MTVYVSIAITIGAILFVCLVIYLFRDGTALDEWRRSCQCGCIGQPVLEVHEEGDLDVTDEDNEAPPPPPPPDPAPAAAAAAPPDPAHAPRRAKSTRDRGKERGG